MIYALCLKLALTGVLLFIVVFFGIHIEPPRRHKAWFEAVVGSLFLIAIFLFFGGGFGAIWTHPS